MNCCRCGDPSDTQLCTLCDEEVKRYAALVAEGGVYWLCDGCGRSGVIPSGDAAAALRAENKTPPPAPLLVAFFRCTQHSRGDSHEADARPVPFTADDRPA
ncbi:MAG TPA: hypothetical protein VGD46_13415 [Rhizobacter sp.]